MLHRRYASVKKNMPEMAKYVKGETKLTGGVEGQDS
jgi:hypothetical protein